MKHFSNPLPVRIKPPLQLLHLKEKAKTFRLKEMQVNIPPSKCKCLLTVVKMDLKMPMRKLRFSINSIRHTGMSAVDSL